MSNENTISIEDKIAALSLEGKHELLRHAITWHCPTSSLQTVFNACATDFTTQDLSIAVQYAINQESIRAVKLFLDHPKFDVNAELITRTCDAYAIQETTPLILAVQRSEIKILELLLAHPNIDLEKIVPSEMPGRTAAVALEQEIRKLEHRISLGDSDGSYAYALNKKREMEIKFTQHPKFNPESHEQNLSLNIDFEDKRRAEIGEIIAQQRELTASIERIEQQLRIEAPEY